MEEISNFIKTIMKNDLENGVVKTIVTRFPPEPNAYLHIGHARAIITNFELAAIFGGKTNLRFDDTNPAKEDTEFVDAIINDVKWLGYKPANIFYGSDYFDKTYQYAIRLIKKGLAYVCDLSQEETSKYRGTLNTPGIDSPYRNRTVEENLKLFEEMKNGVYADSEKVLRAKIDMSSSNINMRDPILYRIMHIHHHRQGSKWCIYPMYDFAHPIQDSIEGITHSLCTIEYEDHRPLYDWVIENCEMPHVSHQYEFGKLNIPNTVMGKRNLIQLVDSKTVIGFDDPRMPTLIGMRRKGITAAAIKNFVLSTGLSKINSTVAPDALDHFVREDLKLKTARMMAVINPLKITITNYEDDKVEFLDVLNNSENESLGTRKIPFSKHLYIEKEDFALEKPDKHYKRLALGLEIRLYNAYFIKANEVVYDLSGEIIEVKCTYDPQTLSGSGFNGRKPNGTIHYVEATLAKEATFNIFEPLIVDGNFTKENFLEKINPNSWIIGKGFIEGSKEKYEVLERFQFIRNGYYAVDETSTKDNLVFNRIVSLKSSFK